MHRMEEINEQKKYTPKKNRGGKGKIDCGN